MHRSVCAQPDPEVESAPPSLGRESPSLPRNALDAWKGEKANTKAPSEIAARSMRLNKRGMKKEKERRGGGRGGLEPLARPQGCKMIYADAEEEGGREGGADERERGFPMLDNTQAS